MIPDTLRRLTIALKPADLEQALPQLRTREFLAFWQSLPQGRQDDILAECPPSQRLAVRQALEARQPALVV